MKVLTLSFLAGPMLPLCEIILKKYNSLFINHQPNSTTLITLCAGIANCQLEYHK